jgi:hypothetical protein
VHHADRDGLGESSSPLELSSTLCAEMQPTRVKSRVVNCRVNPCWLVVVYAMTIRRVPFCRLAPYDQADSHGKLCFAGITLGGSAGVLIIIVLYGGDVRG